MMSNRSRDDFDRLMTSWMEAEGRVREPAELLDRTLNRTRVARRRPRWLVPEWWLSMQNTARLQAVWRPTPVLFVLAALVLGAALIAILVSGSQKRVPPPFGPAANGILTYDAGGSLYVARLDGGGAQALVNRVAHATAATYAPDGQRVVFWGDGSPDSLYAANGDGTNVRKILGGLWISTDKSPSWSPDSRHLVVSTEGGPNRFDEHLVVIDVDGGATSSIDLTGSNGIRAVNPSWSPNGEWIAFQGIAGKDGKPSYWVVRPDGRDAHKLETSALSDTAGAAGWEPSATSQRIVYSAGAGVIYVFDLGTGVETPISGKDGQPANWPAWSPDGKAIAWLTSTHARILTLADPTRVQEVPASGMQAPLAWSPDGTHIYATDASRKTLVVIAVDGSKPAALRFPHVESWGLPSWQRLAP